MTLKPHDVGSIIVEGVRTIPLPCHLAQVQVGIPGSVEGRYEMAAKTPKNSGKEWTPADDRKLDKLANGNTPTGLIAHELGRSESAVYSRASEIDVSLKPVNQSPYNRQKKR